MSDELWGGTKSDKVGNLLPKEDELGMSLAI